MISPYHLIAAAAISVGCFIYGQHVGIVSTEHAQLKIDAAIAEAAQASREAAAAEIAKIKVTNRTINQKVIHEITENRVYSDCRVPASGVQRINEAIEGRLQPDDIKLPGKTKD